MPSYFANSMDIFITAGLIAGGAKAFNKITAVLATFSQTLNERAKGGTS